jgi:tetratricopeptide (TPR) repeat protein
VYGEEYPVEIKIKLLKELFDEAEKENVIFLELLIRQHLTEWHWEKKEYELAFELYAAQAKQLEKVSVKDVPDKVIFLRYIADAYYFFKDYPRAIYFFNKVLENNSDNELLAIELKAGIADFKVFGQISMYLGLLKKEFPQKKIKGIILAGKIDETLKYAVITNENIKIMEYNMELNINEVV